jgi:hypothetical protein
MSKIITLTFAIACLMTAAASFAAPASAGVAHAQYMHWTDSQIQSGDGATYQTAMWVPSQPGRADFTTAGSSADRTCASGWYLGKDGVCYPRI